MTWLRVLGTLTLLFVLSVACSSETYEHIPIDITYVSDAKAGFDVALADETTVHVEQFGLAIGYTRIHLCDDSHATRLQRPFQIFSLPVAHAHSPSTPTSSGIPVVLSTDLPDKQNQDLIAAALRPVPGVEVCSVEIQLLKSDHDAHMLEFFPELEGHASAARIDGTVVGSLAGPPVIFDLKPSLRIQGEIRFEVRFDNAAWQQEIASLDGQMRDAQALADALQDAAMAALRFDLVQHIPADTL